MLSYIKRRGLIFVFGGVLFLFYSQHSSDTEMSPKLKNMKKIANNMFEEEIEDYYEDKVTSFFMYSPEDYPLLAEYDRCLPKHILREYATQRIGGEVYFMRQLKESSWRTSDMEHAALIVVPIYFGIMGRYGKCRKEAESFLSNITLTKKHVLFTLEWINIDLSRYCTECIHMVMYTHPSRPTCQIPAPMSSQLESKWNTKVNSTNSSSLVDWTNRKYAYYFGGCADRPHRQTEYTTRRRFPGTFERIKNNITTGLVQSFVSGPRSGTMDPDFVERMVNTKFGIHWVGDNPISNRVFEWIQVESFLVILSDRFYELAASGTHIPWRNFSIQINETSTDVELDSQLIEISNLPEELIQQRVKIMKRFTKRLLWNMPGSKVAETLLIDAVEKCT